MAANPIHGIVKMRSGRAVNVIERACRAFLRVAYQRHASISPAALRACPTGIWPGRHFSPETRLDCPFKRLRSALGNADDEQAERFQIRSDRSRENGVASVPDASE